jgi:3-isopropylmalate dehydrogenase
LCGGCAIEATGTALPEATLALCRDCDAILFGAAGGPKWDGLPGPERPERALATIRKELGLYVNLRPIRVRECLAPILPLREALVGDGFEFFIVRELVGGLYYAEPRGVAREGEPRGFDTCSYTLHEVERVVRAALELARARGLPVTSVAKENMLESSKVWREGAERVGRQYPDVPLAHMLVDACAYHLVRNPRQFGVLVTENVFGDILSDEAGALAGSLGMCPSASYGDTRQGLYEPIHGTAPDIAGKGIANPIGAILSAALLLRHSFGLEAEAKDIEAAVESTLEAAYRTADIRQTGTKTVGTAGMTDAVLHAVLATGA